MWALMDINGDGHVNYKETENSLKAYFHNDIIDQAKSAIKQAFDFAKDFVSVKKKKSHHGNRKPSHSISPRSQPTSPKAQIHLDLKDDKPKKPFDYKDVGSPTSLAPKARMSSQIEKNEFRVFLVALRQRLEYFEGFSQIDIQGDGEISKEEFLAQIDRV